MSARRPAPASRRPSRYFRRSRTRSARSFPDGERDLIVDNIGLPARSYNLAFGDGTAIGVNDGVILVALKEGHAPTADYVASCAQVLPAAFPEAIFYFQAADMVTQILNFGIPAQIDVRTVGYDRATICASPRSCSGGSPPYRESPTRICSRRSTRRNFFATIDRARAAQFGLTANSIATNLNVSLSSSEQVSPNFWTDPSNGTPYFFAVQTPEHRVSSLNDLKNTPVGDVHGGQRQSGARHCSRTSPRFKRDSIPTNANQANIQPVYEVYANAAGPRSRQRSRARSTRSSRSCRKSSSPATRSRSRPDRQHERRRSATSRIGLLFAAVFVYLLMVVNYQNFGDPFVVILALPATFCGIVTMLYITGTTFNVPSLMGAIMAIGVASANSILLVTFAREQQLDGHAGVRCRDRRRPHPHPAGADDRRRDDRRHDPDGDRRRRRGAERGAGPRRHRRPAVCNADDACLSCPICLPCCGRAMTASPRMACSRRRPA